MESFNQELTDRFDAEGRARYVKECLDLLTPEYKAYGALTYSNVQLAIGNSRGIRRFAAQNAVEFTALVADEKGGSGFARSGGYQSEDVDVVGAFRTAYEKARLNQNPGFGAGCLYGHLGAVGCQQFARLPIDGL